MELAKHVCGRSSGQRPPRSEFHPTQAGDVVGPEGDGVDELYIFYRCGRGLKSRRIRKGGKPLSMGY